MATIIQWNCRGLRANYEELLLLNKNICPAVFALQETLLKADAIINFSNFSVIHKSRAGDRPSGGVALFIRKDILFSQIDLHTSLEAIAVQLTLNKTMTICNLYLSPSKPVSRHDLEDLIDQLPSPFILLGDFNGHSYLWGSDREDSRGKMLEDLFSKLDLCTLNNGNTTYIHPATGTTSILDLSVCQPSLLLDFDWTVHDDLCGSDHFPVLLRYTTNMDAPNVGRWNFKSADWDSFQRMCLADLTEESFASVHEPITFFSEKLLHISNTTIKKTSASSTRIKVPWFNEDIKEAIKNRKKLQRKVLRHPTTENIDNYKRARAKARGIVKKYKKMSWKSFCDSLNSKTPSQKVWKAVRKIKGKSCKTSIKHLQQNDQLLTDKESIANLLAYTLSNNSSAQNYTPEFQRIKKAKEKKKVDFSSDCTEDYNLPFTLEELKRALRKSNDSAVGPDDIHYQLLTHLPEPTMIVLLKLLNSVWLNNSFPESWREATVIPIPKPGKDNSNPNNYRPIALTSCLCKTMERMVNSRLVWFLESEQKLSHLQCGFRANRSTVDHLVRFESFIRNAFVNNEQVLVVFFDLEKAYDTTWKHGILADLADLGVKGHLPKFIEGFLTNRLFKVRVGSTFSDFFEQESGVPQGSILSPALFSIKINNIIKSVLQGTDSSLFVDDFALVIKGKSLKFLERNMQLCINSVQKWVGENGFKFSTSKTQAIHFYNSNEFHPDPDVYLGKERINSVKEAKFLGMIFDQKLTFLPHIIMIMYLKTSCQKSLNLLRVVGHTDWGADRTILLRLYRALVRSKLDYGCIVYGSARKSYIQKLDTIHHQGLRISLGAFRTSPVISLYVEAGEPSLKMRRLKLSFNYVLKVKSLPEHPAYDCVMDPQYIFKYVKNPTAIAPLGVRMKEVLKSANIDFKDVCDDFPFTTTAPWTFAFPNIRFDLSQYKKDTTSPALYSQRFLELCSEYPEYSKLYTDGSKAGGRLGAAVVSDRDFTQSDQERLPDEGSVFTAEARAIEMALKKVEASHDNNFLIFSDSLSVLTALHSQKLEHHILREIQEHLTTLTQMKKTVIFVWIPGHVGIRGNIAADAAAKEALQKSVVESYIHFSDLKPKINEYINSLWQESWESTPENKLFEVEPRANSYVPSMQTNRRKETVLSRLRIGHAYFSHSFLLRGEEPPFCVACNEQYTVRHVLLSCVDLSEIRNKYFSVTSLYTLFREVSRENIFAFLREINLFGKV